MNDFMTIILWTFLPFLELRWSIPHGLLFTELHPIVVVITAIVANILIGWLIYYLLHLVVGAFRKWSWFDTLFKKIIERPRKRIKKYVDKYGELGVAIFIGIPLPGSGVYTAALGSYVLGISKKHFMLATVIGVIIAAILVTLIVVTGSAAWSWMVA